MSVKTCAMGSADEVDGVRVEAPGIIVAQDLPAKRIADRSEQCQPHPDDRQTAQLPPCPFYCAMISIHPPPGSAGPDPHLPPPLSSLHFFHPCVPPVPISNGPTRENDSANSCLLEACRPRFGISGGGGAESLVSRWVAYRRWREGTEGPACRCRAGTEVSRRAATGPGSTSHTLSADGPCMLVGRVAGSYGRASQ